MLLTQLTQKICLPLHKGDDVKLMEISKVLKTDFYVPYYQNFLLQKNLTM